MNQSYLLRFELRYPRARY